MTKAKKIAETVEDYYYSAEYQEWMNAPMGAPVKHITYKTLEGFIRVIKAQNKKLKKLGCVGDFIVRLPLPTAGGKRK